MKSKSKTQGKATKKKVTRMGMKKQPTYRVVIQEQRSKRDGKFIENLGLYDPRQNPPLVQLKADRVNYWLTVGATPTDSVGRLLKMAGHNPKQYKTHQKTPTAHTNP